MTRLSDGVYRVEHAGGADIVYVAGDDAGVWAFWHGEVFRIGSTEAPAARRRTLGARPGGAEAAGSATRLTSPMPATVVKVLVEPGATVRKGDTLLLLEAMKMELPVRAPGDAVVKAVLCREGALVQPDEPLVELA